MTPLADLQRAFTRLCFDEEPSPADLALLHSPEERWLLYRRMVRSRLFSMVRAGLPRSVEVLGEERLRVAMVSYLAERGPGSRFIRDVVHELVEHALPGWRADAGLPSHLTDLVCYEEAKWRVAAAPWGETEELSEELDFEGVPVFNPTLSTLEVRHRVDRDDAPLDAPHLVIVYRKPSDARVFRYVLNPRGAELFEAWQAPGRSLSDGVKALLEARGEEPSAAFIDAMAGILAEMVEQTIVLGSRR